MKSKIYIYIHSHQLDQNDESQVDRKSRKNCASWKRYSKKRDGNERGEFPSLGNPEIEQKYGISHKKKIKKSIFRRKISYNFKFEQK